MVGLDDLVVTNEEWLMERILQYAVERGYAVYTSTLVEAWRLSISGITASIVDAVKDADETPLEFSPYDDYSSDPIARFGIKEARLHRERGVELGMFLGLLKYYRQSYVDLVEEKVTDRGQKTAWSHLIYRLFDKMELAISTEWSGLEDDKRLREIQSRTREMTNEKNRYLTLFESIAAPVFLLDEECKVHNLNSEAAKLLGVPSMHGAQYYAKRLSGYIPQEGQDVLGVYLPDLLPWLADEIEAFRKQDKPYQQIHKNVTLEGKGRSFVINMNAMPDVSGKFAGMSIILTDMTRLYDAECRADTTARRFMVAQECTGVGCWEWDIEKNKIEWSDIVHNVFGRHNVPSSMNFEDFLKLIHPEDQARVDKAVRMALENKEVYQVDHRVIREDGSVCWVAETGGMMLDENGEVERMVGVVMDMSERKQMEDELRHTRDLAEKANEAKGRFLANMSHEIRTPMNAILGMIHLCRRTSLTPKQMQYLDKAESASRTLMGVIGDILDFSRIDSGKLELESITFSIETVLNQLTDVTAYDAHRKGLELVVALSPDVPDHLIGDPLRLGQVLQNLVGNAIKFTSRGEVSVSVELGPKTQDSAELHFVVRDTGVGMTPQQLKHIFEPFRQSDSSMTRLHGGTGLGLSISSALVKMMGGKLTARSNPGMGSTFSFSAVFGRENGTLADSFTVPAKVRGMRVLVVDDSETSCAYLERCLRSFSFEVDTARNGREAIDLVSAADGQNPYSLIVADWQMPEINGVEMATIIRQNASLVHKPAIIMMTAYGRDEIVKNVESLQLEGLLLKPFSPSMLHDVIMQAFGQQVEHRGIKDGADALSDTCTADGLCGIRVLLVEDNEFNRDLARELLRMIKADVMEAVDGEEAVAMVKENDFDVVLMDIQMPNMDGYEATRRIRQLTSHKKNTPVVAMTAHAMRGDRERCLAAGMNDHVAKPVDPKHLYQTLGKWAKGRQMADVTTSEAPGIAPSASSAVFGHSDAISSLEPEEMNAQQTHSTTVIETLKGLEVPRGLMQCMGNERLYNDMLRRFVKQYVSVTDEITALLATGDNDDAERLAHSMKSVSGNIGAMGLQEQAYALELAIKNNGSEAINKALHGFAEELRNVINSIRLYLEIHS